MYGPYLRALSEFNAWGYAVMLPVLIWWVPWMCDGKMIKKQLADRGSK
jgi:hypothetical protein